MNLSRRNLIIAMILIVIIVPTVYFGFYLPTTAPKNVVFVYPLPLVQGFWEYDYAAYAGIYREEGLNVTLLTVRTVPEMVNALVAGEANFAGGTATCMEAIAANAPLKVVLVTARQSFAMVTRPGINSIYDVKTIATVSRDINPYMTTVFLHDHGINPDTIQYRYVGAPGLLPAILGPTDSPTACDAANLGASTYNALQAGCKILWHFAQEYPNFTLSGLVTSDKMVAEKPVILKSMVKAVYRSLAYIMTHKEEAITYAMQRWNIDRAYATFIYEWSYGDKYGGEVHLKLQQIGLPTNMLNYTMQMVGQYLNVATKSLTEWVDTSFWVQAQRELGLS